MSSGEQHEVAYILGHGPDEGTLMLKVQWKGSQEQTWEPVQNLKRTASSLLNEYYAYYGVKSSVELLKKFDEHFARREKNLSIKGSNASSSRKRAGQKKPNSTSAKKPRQSIMLKKVEELDRKIHEVDAKTTRAIANVEKRFNKKLNALASKVTKFSNDFIREIGKAANEDSADEDSKE